MRTPLALALGLASVMAVAALAACESSDGSGSSGNFEFDGGGFDGTSRPGADGGVDAAAEGDGEAGPDGSTGVTTFQIAMTGAGACAVFEDGRMKCWGQPGLSLNAPPVGVAAGQMGAALPYVTTPAPVKKIVGTSEGGFCAIFVDGTMRCWAVSYPGQVNAGTFFDDIKTNIDLGVGRTAVDVAASVSHSCVILDNGKVKCWGQGAQGKLGNGSVADQATPGDALDLGTGRTAKAITASQFFTCALLDDDRVKCWGAGLLANGSDADVGSMPGQMGDNLVYAKLGTDPNTGNPWKVKRVLASNGHACAILANDRVKCWGSGSISNTNAGVLGNGSATIGYGTTIVDDAIPFVDVGNDPNTGKPWTVSDITTGDFHVCVTIPKDGGRVRCWGAEDNFGILGIGVRNGDVGDQPGEMGDNLVDVGLKPGRVPTVISSSYGAVCARVDAAVLDCWGYNHFGALGVGLPDTAPSDNLGDDPSELGANFAETFLQ